MTAQGEGWYADPQDGSRLRWWDGSAWTAHTHAAVPSGWSPRPRLGDGWPRLALAVQASLALTVLLSVFVVVSDRIVLDVWRRLADDPTSVPEAEATRADRLMTASIAEVVVTVVCGVLFIAWLYQAHTSDRTDPAYNRRRSGWAIGGWFVPFVNLWFPFQVVSDLRDGARGEGRPPSAGLQWAWWLCFLALQVGWRATGAFYDSAGEVPDSDLALYADRLETAMAVETVAEVLSVVTAVLAIVMVRQLTAWVRTSPPALVPARAA
ncbi:DUF4328 domain-containing protein [Nocardioides sp. J2M5]|uniref:DUF4328 domain-containing protein n=1 Tax=Nocardioides palaemonis TaxID=2829810 RepID=UPI001BA6236C|nr:DUF4328 domain-containing protein [Nocardioides palaemonis]MBS2939164.1 DUF4328 domain-containing protein [Nocardioides palaemonis]